MIRFVKIRAEDDVLLDNDGNGVNGFAWYNTITDTFLDWEQDCVWATWEDFERTLREVPDHPYSSEIERFRGLFQPEALK